MDENMGEKEMLLTVSFSEAKGVTTVTTNIQFASQSDRDAALETGMTDGVERSYQSLDKLLAD